MNLSRSQLHNKLKALSGLSSSHFIQHVKIEHAKKLLITTDQNIAEVAFQSGFSDPNYFSRVFTKTVGKSPSAFRRRPSNS